MDRQTLYNSRVRDLMSQEYRRISSEKQELCKRKVELINLMSDVSISHRDYVEYENEMHGIDEEMILLNIELNVWDKAREICFNAADDVCDK